MLRISTVLQRPCKQIYIYLHTEDIRYISARPMHGPDLVVSHVASRHSALCLVVVHLKSRQPGQRVFFFFTSLSLLTSMRELDLEDHLDTYTQRECIGKFTPSLPFFFSGQMGMKERKRNERYNNSTPLVDCCPLHSTWSTHHHIMTPQPSPTH